MFLFVLFEALPYIEIHLTSISPEASAPHILSFPTESRVSPQVPAHFETLIKVTHYHARQSDRADSRYDAPVTS